MMLQHQAPPPSVAPPPHPPSSSSSLRNRKYDQDGNSNFLSSVSNNKDDENRNQVRPRSLGPLGKDQTPPPPHGTNSTPSPRPRLPPWSKLEPLPELETVPEADGYDDGFGRVPPDGAEERRITEEEAREWIQQCEERQREKLQAVQRRRSSVGLRLEHRQEVKEVEEEEEWGADSASDSDSESMVSLQLEGGGAGGEESALERWDCLGLGETKRRSLSRKHYGSLIEEDEEQSSDSDGDDGDGGGELLDAVWTLRDRERFKAQEMEKHQIQLTMYRRLALIRWVRTLQNRVLEQQNRLQSSFDLILTHRKELLRVGASNGANEVANAAAVGES